MRTKQKVPQTTSWRQLLAMMKTIALPVALQIHLYSMKWIKPVSDTGKQTIGAFRQRYGINQ